MAIFRWFSMNDSNYTIDQHRHIGSINQKRCERIQIDVSMCFNKQTKRKRKKSNK